MFSFCPGLSRRASTRRVDRAWQVSDQLFSGSMADNICFFDTVFDSARMIRCAQQAGIHEEIMAMPMTYNTLIGDMGSSLSGGQKQRVLLARALYHQPKILFLDEGTAHLDVDTERRVSETLKQLPMTRISVAHRPADGADRIVWIAKTLKETHNTRGPVSLPSFLPSRPKRLAVAD